MCLTEHLDGTPNEQTLLSALTEWLMDDDDLLGEVCIDDHSVAVQLRRRR